MVQPYKFRDLDIGETFDFIGPDRRFNSFYDRCVKVSPRKYKSLESGQEMHQAWLRKNVMRIRDQAAGAGVPLSPVLADLCELLLGEI